MPKSLNPNAENSERDGDGAIPNASAVCCITKPWCVDFDKHMIWSSWSACEAFAVAVQLSCLSSWYRMLYHKSGLRGIGVGPRDQSEE
jgi:hypothetical protein